MILDSHIGIAFCGRMGSGKTTAANYLVNSVKQDLASRPFVVLSYADPLKLFAKVELGFDKRNAAALQAAGTVTRAIEPDRVLCIMRERLRVYSPANVVAIDDLRMRNEFIDAKLLGFYIVHIEASIEVRLARIIARDGLTEAEAGAIIGGRTEQEIVHFASYCDATIVNDSDDRARFQNAIREALPGWVRE